MHTCGRLDRPGLSEKNLIYGSKESMQNLFAIKWKPPLLYMFQYVQLFNCTSGDLNNEHLKNRNIKIRNFDLSGIQMVVWNSDHHSNIGLVFKWWSEYHTKFSLVFKWHSNTIWRFTFECKLSIFAITVISVVWSTCVLFIWLYGQFFGLMVFYFFSVLWIRSTRPAQYYTHELQLYTDSMYNYAKLYK